MNKNILNEIPKYKKNTGSNISDSAKKTKHKHHYEECLIKYNFSFHGKEPHITTDLQSYCIICGKIGNKEIAKEDLPTFKSNLKHFCSIIVSNTFGFLVILAISATSTIPHI